MRCGLPTIASLQGLTAAGRLGGRGWRRGRHTRAVELMANPFEFIQQVRAEASKVTWPTRRETLITTGLVILMVLAASIFFVSVDWLIRAGVQFIMSLGH